MNQDEMKDRTKAYALRVIKLAEALPDSPTARVLGGQILRSGTSVGANYRASCRARSPKEFQAKLGVVLQEADETAFRLELIVESGLQPQNRVQPLLNETDEICAIPFASIRTSKAAKD